MYFSDPATAREYLNKPPFWGSGNVGLELVQTNPGRCVRPIPSIARLVVDAVLTSA